MQLQIRAGRGPDSAAHRARRLSRRATASSFGFSPPRSAGTAYVDVVKEGQTVLTRDLDIVDGQAELALTATPDLAGTLDFNAYLFGE